LETSLSLSLSLSLLPPSISPPPQCFLEDYFPDSEGPRVGGLMAVMAVIGGIDGRLRLGGQVVHEEHGEGTVTRITPKGRITVQFQDMRTSRVCLLVHLKPVRGGSWCRSLLPRGPAPR